MSEDDGKRACSRCGKRYFPGQVWMHTDCVVANSPAVANTAAPVVANRKPGDRHKDKGARREYMRKLMATRRSAARARVGP